MVRNRRLFPRYLSMHWKDPIYSHGEQSVPEGKGPNRPFSVHLPDSCTTLPIPVKLALTVLSGRFSVHLELIHRGEFSHSTTHSTTRGELPERSTEQEGEGTPFCSLDPPSSFTCLRSCTSSSAVETLCILLFATCLCSSARVAPILARLSSTLQSRPHARSNGQVDGYADSCDLS